MPQTQENSLPHLGKNKCHFFRESTCRLQQQGSESINLRNITENDMAEHIVKAIASAGIPENLLIELKTVLAKIMKYVKDMGNDQRISINDQ